MASRPWGYGIDGTRGIGARGLQAWALGYGFTGVRRQRLDAVTPETGCRSSPLCSFLQRGPPEKPCGWRGAPPRCPVCGLSLELHQGVKEALICLAGFLIFNCGCSPCPLGGTGPPSASLATCRPSAPTDGGTKRHGKIPSVTRPRYSVLMGPANGSSSELGRAAWRLSGTRCGGLTGLQVTPDPPR